MAVVRSTYGGGSAKKEPENEQSYKGSEERSRGTLGRDLAIWHPIADLAAIDVEVAGDESEGAARRDTQISRHPNPTSARTEEKDSTNSTTHTQVRSGWVFCLGVFAWLRVGRAVAALRRAAGFGWLASARGAVKGKGVVSGFQTSQNQLPTTSFRLAPQAASSSSTAPPRRRARALPRDGHADDRHRRQS